MRPILVGILLAAIAAAPSVACPATRGLIPPLLAALDSELLEGKRPAPDMEKLKGMRAQIAALAAEQKIKDARKLEERAMAMLGYRKTWLHCGPGTFLWMKAQPKPVRHQGL